jgi:hypothetical protein
VCQTCRKVFRAAYVEAKYCSRACQPRPGRPLKANILTGEAAE